MNYITIEDKIEHCKASIRVCEEKILAERPNENKFWIEFKKEWEKQLNELNKLK